MHEIEMHTVSEDFADCWRVAGSHLQSQSHDAKLSWLKASLTPPFLEHLSFRIGNQLFFVRVVDVDDKVIGPGNPNGFRTIADGCRGHACLMPMRKTKKSFLPTGNKASKWGKWGTDAPGWGLVNPVTNAPVEPLELVSDENVEMTNWEIHDFAVQIVRDHVTEELGHELMSSQGNPRVDPSIWFVGDGGPEWVVVRATRYPQKDAPRPANLPDIVSTNREQGKQNWNLEPKGHFASVSFANSDDPFDPENNASPTPLWRGHGTTVSFSGLQDVKE